MGRAVAVYTGLRLLLFAGTYVVLRVAGLRGLLALAAALLISSIASPFALRRHREAVAAQLAARHERRQAERDRLRGMLDG